MYTVTRSVQAKSVADTAPSANARIDRCTVRTISPDNLRLYRNGQYVKGCVASMKRLIGHVLDGKVALSALIGEGGMGAVYRGRQLSFDREVAVKVMKPQFLASEDLVRRFYREA